jgi:DNA-binding winged helix-turn-helix (wHTH) protein
VAPPPNEQTNHTAVSGYYRIGATKVFPRQNQLACPDNSFIQLRPKSFDVLLHLCRKNGQLVEKETLVKAVWKDVCVTDDSLVQCIVDIRKALGSDSKLLRTITRRGYMLTATHTNTHTASSTTSTPTLIVGPFQCTDNAKDTQVAGGLCDGVIARLLDNKSVALHINNTIARQKANYQVNCNLQLQGERARVAVQLVDRLSGQYLWANIYDKNANDTFSLQDHLSRDIAADLISQIQHQTVDGEKLAM